MLKKIQGKIVTALSPIFRLWSMIEKERNTSGNENDEGLKECVTLFEQSVFLIVQVLNTLPYQRRQIALSTLIENNVRVKEIIITLESGSSFDSQQPFRQGSLYQNQYRGRVFTICLHI